MSDDELGGVLGEATRVRVSEVWAEPGCDVAVSSGDAAAVRALRKLLVVDQVMDGYCMCNGDVQFDFLNDTGRTVASVSFHHGVHLRWSGWDGDALVRDGEALLGWLADNGIDGPLRHHRAVQQDFREMEAAAERWTAAAPEVVRDLLDLAFDNEGAIAQPVYDLLAERLNEAIPGAEDRAAALLIWYGSGTGRCTGYPVHEELPEQALAALPIADIIAALEAAPDDSRLEAGAVRHLCGWKSRPEQARDIAQLPPDLRERLLASARRSGDDDKRGRAEQWLAGA